MLRWQGEGVELAGVLEQLERMRAEMARPTSGQPHPSPRNCVLDLVACVLGGERAALCDRVVEAIAPSHPMRAILLHLEPGDGARLDAEVTLEAHHLLSGMHVQREQVLLHVHGRPAEHPASLIEPLLVPDVPAYLWWEAGDLDHPALEEVLAATDVLIVDPARFASPADTLVDLARLSRHRDVADLEWARLRPWREAVARLFTPLERRTWPWSLQELRLECAGSGASYAGSALLAGWMLDALGWRLTRAAGEPGVVTAEAADGRQVRLSFHAAPSPTATPGDLTAVRMEGRAGERACALAVERDAERGDLAWATVRVGESEFPRQSFPIPRPEEAELLLRALSANRHVPLYLRSLALAASLLEATR